MRISEVINVNQQVSESELASLALRTFREVFRKSPERATYTIRAAHPAFDQLQFRLVTPHQAKVQNAEGWMENDDFDAFITLCFLVPNDFDKTVTYLASKKFEMVFRHEFQHYLDKVEKRFDFRKSIDGAHDLEGYYNSDIEYPAFFKEQAEPLLAILRAAKAGQSVDGLTKIEPDFRKFIEHQHNQLGVRGFSIKKFNPETKQRYLRDMAMIHKAVRAVTGATAPFTPSMLTRILAWLANKTGIRI